MYDDVVVFDYSILIDPLHTYNHPCPPRAYPSLQYIRHRPNKDRFLHGLA